MPISTAIRCKVLDLIDPRYARTATGLGKAEIVGRCHYLPIEICGDVLHYSINVISFDQRIDFLIGLDFMRHYNCDIDVSKNTNTFYIGHQRIQLLSPDQLETYQVLV